MTQTSMPLSQHQFGLLIVALVLSFQINQIRRQQRALQSLPRRLRLVDYPSIAWRLDDFSDSYCKLT